MLRELDADVICLQEVYSNRDTTSDAERLGTVLGLHAIHTSSDPTEQSLGNALLSRWPIEAQGERPLPDSGGTAGQRTALWAVLRAPFGPVPVISTHLAYRFDESSVRQLQTGALTALAAGLRHPDSADAPPVVLCGDLNAVPDSDEIRLITGRSAAAVPGLVFNDCWPQVRDDPGHTWVRRNPHLADSFWPERRLDYVLVSWPRPAPLGNPVQAFLVGDGPVDGIWPSDHLGVGVDLRLRN